MENKKNIDDQNNKRMESIKNQLFKNYQNSVVDHKLENNKDVYTFNNKSK